jgi:uncharacterized protein (DUF2336 family)
VAQPGKDDRQEPVPTAISIVFRQRGCRRPILAELLEFPVLAQTTNFITISKFASMAEARSLLAELDEAVVRGSPEKKEKALRYAADVLTVGRFAEDEIWVFGEVIGRLADAIEVEARSRLAEQLAHIAQAPANIVVKLAFDDAIGVAGPVLRHSERLDPRALIENIRTKSQQHMLAISQRKSLPIVVTDELIRYGNREVITSVASNRGASFSDAGFLQMIQRAENDGILAERLGLRRDIPRWMFQQLIAKASAEVRRKLEHERPEFGAQIQNSVAEVTGSLHSKFGPASKGYFEAKKKVGARKHDGHLHETSILNDALDHKHEEVVVGLSLLCGLPANVVERALRDNEMTLVLAGALAFAWETAMALLFLRAKDHRINARQLDDMKRDFVKLDKQACREVLQTYQSNRAAGANGRGPNVR